MNLSIEDVLITALIISALASGLAVVYYSIRLICLGIWFVVGWTYYTIRIRLERHRDQGKFV